jgi:2',3'-cyclic-nucleotide 2'-phosphodiesterase (5'-nucleotidase family)
MIKGERAKNPEGVILLSAGDMFQGTPISNLFRGGPVLEVMNSLRFDAMTLGNHEFDWGRSALAEIIRKAAFPLISANIVDQKGLSLTGVKPYVIIERKGLRVAVIGFTAPETAYTTKPEHVSDLRFIEPAKVLPGLLKEVKGKGAQLVVLLTHLGLDADEELAAAVEGIDLIVGGHSHTVVTDPVVVGKTIIVQAGYNGLYLGVMELTLDEKSGKILDATRKGELKLVSAGPKDRFDKDIGRIADSYGEQIKDRFREVVGETRVDLTRRFDGESIMGDVVTDAMRESTGADIALQNSGGIRADVPAGRITMEAVYTVLPFDNELVVMDLKGADILHLFEKGASLNKGVLQVSGVHIKYDLSLPLGRRVADVRVGGLPFDPSRTYRVVTNDFLSAGGDNFTDFQKGSNVAHEGTLRDAFTEYLKKHSPVSPRLEGRILTMGK